MPHTIDEDAEARKRDGDTSDRVLNDDRDSIPTDLVPPEDAIQTNRIWMTALRASIESYERKTGATCDAAFQIIRQAERELSRDLTGSAA